MRFFRTDPIRGAFGMNLARWVNAEELTELLVAQESPGGPWSVFGRVRSAVTLGADDPRPATISTGELVRLLTSPVEERCLDWVRDVLEELR